MGRILDAFSQYFDGAGDPLVNGWLKFLQSGTNNTDKTTYADSSETIANANPVQLDGEGRVPNVFGNGSYRVILYTNDELLNEPAEQIAMFDPVGGTSGTSNFQDWNASATYDESDIVTYEGEYYRSKTNDNINNEPDINSQYWEQIDFLKYWNSTTSYSIGDNVLYDVDGYFYRSLTNNNVNNIPPDEDTEWAPLSFYDTSTLMNNPATEDLDMDDYQVQQPLFFDSGDVAEIAGNITGAVAIDISALGNVYTGTVTGDVTFTFTNPSDTGNFCMLIMELTDGGSYTITFPASVVWDSETPPELQETGVDILIFTTRDAGVTWYGKRGWKEV